MTDKQAIAADFAEPRSRVSRVASGAVTAPAAVARTGEIRPLTPEDIPAVAGIYQRVFLKRGRPLPALAGQLQRQFLSPARGDIHSLVYERDGAIGGFVGAIPQTLMMDGREVRVAILTSFMVDDHASDPMGGAKLLRAMVAGPQDITISETASQTSVAMWRSLRGAVLPAYSLDWLKILSPARFMAARVGKRVKAVRLAKPLAAAVDRVIARRSIDLIGWAPLPASTEANEITTRELTQPEAVAAIRSLSQAYAVHPAWSGEMLDERLGDAWVKADLGPVTCRAVMARGPDPIGLFLYHGARDGIGHVLQVLAKPGRGGLVVDQMFRHASENGIVALRGRADPVLLDAMLGRGCSFSNVSTTVAMARDKSLLTPLLTGTALITGLAGETWLPLNGNDFSA